MGKSVRNVLPPSPVSNSGNILDAYCIHRVVLGAIRWIGLFLRGLQPRTHYDGACLEDEEGVRMRTHKGVISSWSWLRTWHLELTGEAYAVGGGGCTPYFFFKFLLIYFRDREREHKQVEGEAEGEKSSSSLKTRNSTFLSDRDNFHLPVSQISWDI